MEEAAETIRRFNQHAEPGIIGRTIRHTVLIGVLIDCHGLARRQVFNLHAMNDLLHGESLLAWILAMQQGSGDPDSIGSGKISLESGAHGMNHITKYFYFHIIS